VIPWDVVERLNLQMVDQVQVRGYDEKDFRLSPVFSVHLTIHGLCPILARVIPKESEDYAILGRDILNEWLLKLHGPNQSGIIEIQPSASQ